MWPWWRPRTCGLDPRHLNLPERTLRRYPRRDAATPGVSRSSGGERGQAVAYLLEDAHLTGREDHPVSHLSGGEQQRVALARALVTHPRLLLADEPTGNVDAAIAEELGKALVTYVRNNGAVAVMATHSAILASLCDRIFVLQDGRVSPVTDS